MRGVGAVRWTAMSAFLVLALAGCSQNDDATQPRAAVRESDATGENLPLDAYVLSPREQRIVESGRFNLEQACLQRFRLSGITSTIAWRVTPFPSSDRMFDSLDEQQIERLGYHREDPSAGPQWRSVRPRKVSRTLQNDASSVLFGTVKTYLGSPVPAKGCVGEADAKLWGAYPADKFKTYPEDLVLEAMSRTNADKKVVQAVGRWTACMKSLGYSFRTPAEAADKFMRAPKITSQEIKTAGHDLGCRESTDLQKLWRATEATNQQKLIDKNETQLSQFRDAKEEWLKNARVAGA